MSRKTTTTSRLRQKFTLQQEVRTPDTSGGYTRSWEDVTDVWAVIAPMSSREKLMAMQLESEVTHRMTLRARAEIDASQRLTGDGRNFYIRSVTPMNKGEVLELLVEERAGV